LSPCANCSNQTSAKATGNPPQSSDRRLKSGIFGCHTGYPIRSRWETRSRCARLSKLFPKNSHTAHYRYRDVELHEPARIEQPAAAALLLRRETFEEIGRFDEQFAPAWFEDVDFCRRLAANGKSVWVVPTARAKHYGGASLEHLTFGQFVDIWYRNMWLYAQKWLKPGERETLRWLVITGMILRLGAAALGIAHPEVGRRGALRAYAGVLKKAFDRWSA